MSIDWKPIVSRLDADPRTPTPQGMAILSALVSAGTQYDSAGGPDVLRESSQHVRWSGLQPSQRLNVKEPPFYDAAYYDRPFGRRGRAAATLDRVLTMPEAAPAAARQAYAFWRPRELQVSNRIASYYIAKARDEENARRPQGPTNGRIQETLLAAVAAAEAWLDG